MLKLLKITNKNCVNSYLHFYCIFCLNIKSRNESQITLSPSLPLSLDSSLPILLLTIVVCTTRHTYTIIYLKLYI